MFFFTLVLCKAVHALFDHEEGGPFGCVGQHREQIGVAAGGNELLGPADAVAGHLSGVVQHRIGLGLEGRQIAACAWFGHGIGHQSAAFGNGAQPLLLLLRGGPHQDGIGAQLNGEKGGGDSQADLGHFLGNSATIARTAAHTAIFFRDKEQLQTDFRPQHFAHHLLWEKFAMVPIQNILFGQQLFAKLADCFHHHLT